MVIYGFRLHHGWGVSWRISHSPSETMRVECDMSQSDLRRLFASSVAISVNAVIALASTAFFAAIGIKAGLRPRVIPMDDTWALGFAAFTIFYAVSVMVICVARNSTLNWLLTGFSLFCFTVALVLTGLALSE